jgi:hypothetical protein
MATTHLGNQAVPSGYYVNATRWAIEPVAADGGRLPAGPGAWRRIPTALALLATPVLGLAFLVFLPLVGFLLTLQAAVSPLVGLVHGSAAGMAATMSPGWQPGEAHLTGKREERETVEAQGPPGAADEELEALQREIERRRRA